MGIFPKRLRSRVVPRNMSEKANMLIIPTTRGQLPPLDTERSTRRYPMIVNNIGPCPKRCLLMPLARVGARTDSTMHYSYNARRGKFPRTRIGIDTKTRRKICSMRRGFYTLVLFIHQGLVMKMSGCTELDSLQGRRD